MNRLRELEQDHVKSSLWLQRPPHFHETPHRLGVRRVYCLWCGEYIRLTSRGEKPAMTTGASRRAKDYFCSENCLKMWCAAHGQTHHPDTWKSFYKFPEKDMDALLPRTTFKHDE